MPFLTEANLFTHLYQEVIDEIKRTDTTLPQQCIWDAVDEAKAYLSRYDLLKLFGTNTTDPEVDSPMLKNTVKDIACWYIVRKANPNINMEVFRLAYEDAIKKLSLIMKGQMNPDGWPLPIDTATGETMGNLVVAKSNRKRSNYF